MGRNPVGGNSNRAATLLALALYLAGALSRSCTVFAEPPAAATLAAAHPEIARDFFGCWTGIPREFDAVEPASSANSLYRLRRITKCYLPGRIETREFALELRPRHPFLSAVLSLLGLGSHGATIVAEQNGVYKASTTQIHSRGNLTLELSVASLFQLPASHRTTLIDEEVATLRGPDTLVVSGRVVLTGAGAIGEGSWHADFHQ